MPNSLSLTHRIAGKFFSSLHRIMQKLSPTALARLGTGIGHLIWYLLPKRRTTTIERVKKHLPHLADTDAKATRFAHQSMCENGRSFVELFATQRFNKSSINHQIHIAEPDLYEQLTHSSRPVVAVTAHIGSWELMVGLLGSIFPEGIPCAVVVRKQNFEPIQRILLEQRGISGVQVINHHQAAPQVLRVLKRNGVVAFLADHNTKRNKALFIPFLGHIAAVNKGPALLAIRTKAVIYPTCLVRNTGESYSHTFHTFPPLDTTTLTGSLEEQIAETCIFITKATEQMVLAYPEQWFWMHNRWKTQPQAEVSPPSSLSA